MDGTKWFGDSESESYAVTQQYKRLIENMKFVFVEQSVRNKKDKRVDY